jgi:hypothetical protein
MQQYNNKVSIRNQEIIFGVIEKYIVGKFKKLVSMYGIQA